ncbi:MAG: hypothetical protein RSE13_08515 [Planktothrix sp. GU0601_MAG3]|nr:MAG: hypothetical protein RSE13_08515 [Planktothrix sp. GU0601_MAG3]
MNLINSLTQIMAKLRCYLIQISQFCQSQGVIFAITMGVLSRSLILLVFFIIAQLQQVSSETETVKIAWGWQIFSAWDSPLYQGIATSGYEVINQTETRW